MEIIQVHGRTLNWQMLVSHATKCQNDPQSETNLKESCFGAEACLYDLHIASLDDLLRCDYLFIALYHGEFAGCAAADKKNDVLFIHSLCVNEKFRDQRVGSNLMDKFKSMHTSLYLNVRPPVLEYNLPPSKQMAAIVLNDRYSRVRNFYEKHGFKLVGKSREYHTFGWEE